MRSIGLDVSLDDLYESVGGTWRAIVPPPVTALAEFVAAAPWPILSERSMVFREESFDATTRVRRGRLYVPAGQSRQQAWALPHPVYGALGSANRVPDGRVERTLRVFEPYQVATDLFRKQLIIGAPESAWFVLAAERISTGELLLTLKARRAFGILPELSTDLIPEVGRHAVVETTSKLLDAAYREAPGSVVDRARDAAHACLAAWAVSERDDPKLLTDDLGPLIKRLLHHDTAGRRHAFMDAANLVRLLHARGKWNERKKRELRPISEDDAELAIRAVGFLIQEFGWAQAVI